MPGPGSSSNPASAELADFMGVEAVSAQPSWATLFSSNLDGLRKCHRHMLTASGRTTSDFNGLLGPVWKVTCTHVPLPDVSCVQLPRGRVGVR